MPSIKLPWELLQMQPPINTISAVKLQDAFALESYSKSTSAWKTGAMQQEVIPVTVPQRRGKDLQITQDEEFTNVVQEKFQNYAQLLVKRER